MQFTKEKIDLALEKHSAYSEAVKQIRDGEKILGTKNQNLEKILKEQQEVQNYLKAYFGTLKDGTKNAVTTATEILQRRTYRLNQLEEDGNTKLVKLVNLGIKFLHEQFNNDNLFPLDTFFTLVAGSGIGKSDYFYRMTNSFLMQGFKVLICSFEFGEGRLADLIAPKEDGGKDRMRESRLAGKFDNLIVNYGARDLESLEYMIDEAHHNGVEVILIDSFGEIERQESEYILQQKISIMLNSKKNDYGIFIGLIAQVGNNEVDGEYKIRGGNDLIYKPDLSIHIKKTSAEDTSGDRIVHLFKNRETDFNGKTIVTKYNFETREPEYKCEFIGLDSSTGQPIRDLPKMRLKKK